MTQDISIIPMTTALLDADDKGLSDLCAILGVVASQTWPPEFHGPDTRNRMRTFLDQNPDQARFGGYYLIAAGTLAGFCGFKGPPDETGTVEIGYSVCTSEQRKGYATRAVRDLLRIAFADPRVTMIKAQTLPALIASQRTALGAGFTLTDTREKPGPVQILTYTIPRNATV